MFIYWSLVERLMVALLVPLDVEDAAVGKVIEETLLVACDE